MRIVNTTNLNETTAVAPGTELVGATIACNQAVSMSFQLNFDDTEAAMGGLFKIQISNESPTTPDYLGFQPTVWADLYLHSATVVTGSPVCLPVNHMTFRYIRSVLRVDTPGTTNAVVRMFGLSL